jgi:hypothetical protein
MSGHPPFPAQVILNGHEYVAATARRLGSGLPRRATVLLGWRIRRAWPRSQVPCRSLRLLGAWARSATGGSTLHACASAWTRLGRPVALRDHVIAPVIAGTRSPRRGRKPAHWTAIDRDYETLRIGMQTLFHDLGIATPDAAAA